MAHDHSFLKKKKNTSLHEKPITLRTVQCYFKITINFIMMVGYICVNRSKIILMYFIEHARFGVNESIF
jgi:hypothetical protein